MKESEDFFNLDKISEQIGFYKLSNGMNDYKHEKPKESKPYLVMFSYQNGKSRNWFEVINYQHKCKKWKRLDHLAIGWMELPSDILYRIGESNVLDLKFHNIK